MIPKYSTGSEAASMVLDYAEQPTRTYRLDTESGRIAGMTDGLEALRQAVLKILLTERFAHLIYSPDYGSELRAHIGYSLGFVQSELQRTITEALMQDDRVLRVDEFAFEQQGDSLHVRFTVETNLGKLQISKEVKMNG
ncbi:DUF2634 domain-containing protein [Paenibacillus profundus]|uniref:DUF2634 domain-containing protein n=1 Tax=Paenibacillus profundus TaxID=1173085 RepID=A0ABS8YHD3_9BACL|nr:DUF2634 domain-containing protein [Paenibacillus profundus]MCE5171363.1 DUF2634 domain-containing protein [Paenibacillus profundus]